jgi:hypothetical protein
METLKPTPTEKAPEENFVIPENSTDRSKEFTYPQPDWKKDGWSVEGVFEEPAQSDATASREAAQIREITAGLGEAPKEYKTGVITERLSGGYEGSTDSIAPPQLEHFYEQSTSPELETQRDLSENLRGLSRAQMAQWAEYLAARKAAAPAETAEKAWPPRMTGGLYDTPPRSESAPEEALSLEEMELLHSLGSAEPEASGSAFKERLESLAPAQTEQLMDYLLSREEDTAESARIIHRMSPEQLERIHVMGLSDAKEDFGRQVNALTAEQYDQLMAYRARRILNPNSGSGELGTELSPEQGTRVTAAVSSNDGQGTIRNPEILKAVTPDQAGNSNGSSTAGIARPNASVDTPPKRRWWNIFGRRRGRKNSS